MRESYRLNKPMIAERFIEGKKSLDIVFMYVGARSTPSGRITFNEINLSMQKLVTMALQENKG
jgi:hypothetical protein